ncbi:GNAT family N-acetyltransferase [Kitasatospora kazusensis]|uniref:GNAT family N-acetyltransferase n=1 Tax=Kitasatospora kazusensis TaxID=407974 RepID=A0ABN2ZXN7_9ACTN
MVWTLSTSLDEFHREAGSFLAAHPAENTVLLTVLDRLGKAGPHVYGPGTPRFGWWRSGPGGPVSGVFLQTPPAGPLLGRMSKVAAAHLADVLRGAGEPVPTVTGEKGQAEAFGWVWGNASGVKSAVQATERMYRLGELAVPDPLPSGRDRIAVGADRELLVSWHDAFKAELRVSVPADLGRLVDHRTAEGSLLVREDGAGRPVAFAGASPVVAGMSRIGPVYTPPELRGRGYASAVVAAASAHALAQGAREVLLFTDLANPTSNSIYQKIGYRPLQDHLVLDLNPAG